MFTTNVYNTTQSAYNTPLSCADQFGLVGNPNTELVATGDMGEFPNEKKIEWYNNQGTVAANQTPQSGGGPFLLSVLNANGGNVALTGATAIRVPFIVEHITTFNEGNAGYYDIVTNNATTDDGFMAIKVDKMGDETVLTCNEPFNTPPLNVLNELFEDGDVLKIYINEYGAVNQGLNIDLNVAANPPNGAQTFCTPQDTDNDGIANHLDLDSDGDGCSDALEAGATTDTSSDFQFPTTNVGANGLDDSLEGSPEDGVINYTSTYETFAIDSTQQAPNCPCTDPDLMADNCDFDGDGIPNGVDLDDDNDGILDTEECNLLPSVDVCGDFDEFPEQANWSTLTPTGAGCNTTWEAIQPPSITTTFEVGGGTNGVDGFGWYQMDVLSPQGGNYIGIATNSSGSEAFGINIDNFVPGETYTVTFHWANCGRQTSERSPAFPQVVLPDGSFLDGNGGVTQVYDNTQWFYEELTFVATSMVGDVGFRINGSGSKGLCFDDIRIYGGDGTCPDTDNDGIANQFDLDSDDDGCSDALEAGATTNTSSDFQFPTNNVGANGLDDSLEGSPEDGVINYTSTYETLALDSTTFAPNCPCTDPTLMADNCDFDGDGIPNGLDLDDDNDGVLDTEEAPACTSAGNLNFNLEFTNLSAYTTNFATLQPYSWQADVTDGGTTVANLKYTAKNNAGGNPSPYTTGFANGIQLLNTSTNSTTLSGAFGNSAGDNIVVGAFNVGNPTFMEYTSILENTTAAARTYTLSYVSNASEVPAVNLGVNHNKAPSTIEVTYDAAKVAATVTDYNLANLYDPITSLHTAAYSAGTETVAITSGEIFTIGNGSSGIIGEGGNTTNSAGYTVNFTITLNAGETTNIVFRDRGATQVDNYGFMVSSFIPCENEVDTDNDGIADKFDLDSDGDGCPDALEAGVPLNNADLMAADVTNGNGTDATANTTNSIANAQLDPNGTDTTPEDGLNDSVDTDGDGATDYTSTYAANALDANVQGPNCPCTDPTMMAANCDFDGDGINNGEDLDDDNDGVLDSDEYAVCPTPLLSNGNLTSLTDWTQDQVIHNNGFVIPQEDCAFPDADNFILSQQSSVLSTNFEFNKIRTGLAWNNGTGSGGTCSGSDDLVLIMSVNGTDYLKMTTHEGGTTNQNIGTATVEGLNGATTSVSSINPGTYQSWTATPVDVTLPATVVFQEVAFRLEDEDGSDDIAIDFVEILTVAAGGSGTVLNCLQDTDNDGIANHFDLDSDGDGCYDSFEAGVTGATTDGSVTDSLAATTMAEVGNNGFANSLESDDTNAATANYTATYADASDANVNNCPQPCTDPDLYANNCDFDGDGVDNIDDIDDDNDGILDTDEGSFCNAKDVAQFVLPANLSNDTTLNYDISSSFNLPANTVILNWWGANTNNSGRIELLNNSTIIEVVSTRDFYSAVIFGSTIDVNENNSIEVQQGPNYQFHGVAGTGVTVNNAHPLYQISNSSSTASNDGTYVYQTNTLTDTYKIKLESTGPTGSIIILKLCFPEDTDNDGIANHFDLDSDGDGCYDSFEAGVTGATADGSLTDSLAATTMAEVGVNGFANSLESDDTNAATANYTATYADAADVNVNNCPQPCTDPTLMADNCDFDGDGIDNIDDLDDDNDGILDAEEGSICVPARLWVNTGSNQIGYYDLNSATYTSKCNTTRTYGDIGWGTDGVLYGVDFNADDSDIYSIDTSTCAETFIGSFTAIADPSLSDFTNSLSFLPDGTALIGSGQNVQHSSVYRVTISPFSVSTWHDFGTGRPGGDFVLIDGKIYVSWLTPSFAYHLYEVTYDANYNYVSHIDLGQIPADSWGLANLSGQLYSVSNNSIYELNISSPPTVNNIHTSAESFYGATSFSEGFMFCQNDQDGDGILNHFDLDSDGDGCYDAFEAGVTGATTDGSVTDSLAATTPSEVGNNGFANSLESDDTNAATANYTATYADASDANVNNCPNPCTDPTLMAGNCDFDGDGVDNEDDLDDDNDGILDSEECPVNAFFLDWTTSGLTDAGISAAGGQTIDMAVIHSDFAGIDMTVEHISTNYGSSGNQSDLINTPLPIQLLVANTQGETQQVKVTFSQALPNTEVQAHYNFEFLEGEALNINSAGMLETPLAGDAIDDGIITSNSIQNPLGGSSTSHNYFNTTGNGILYNVASTTIDYTQTLAVGGSNAIEQNGFAILFEITNCDNDSDGIANHFDLDSDGDGCYDSFEAGVTGATNDGSVTDSLAATTMAEVGNNGFANSLESDDTNAATANYTATYADATDANVNNCLQPCTDPTLMADGCDFDGDGVNNEDDLDDDNDGVLDIDEQSCTTSAASAAVIGTDTGVSGNGPETLTFSGGGQTIIGTLSQTGGQFLGGSEGTIVRFSEFGGDYPFQNWNLSLSQPLYNLDIFFANLERIDANTSADFKIEIGNFVVTYEDGSVVSGQSFNLVNDNHNGHDEFGSVDPGLENFNFNGTPGIRPFNQAPGAGGQRSGTLEFASTALGITNISWQVDAGTSGGPTAGVGISGSTIGGVTTCTDLNSDTDGIPNRFDLDSDDDGCSDAFESGATTDLATDYQFPITNVGTNGLDDSLEGANDDGVINYTSTYDPNALDDQIKSCNQAPEITNHNSDPTAAQNYAENGTGDVIDWNATDADGDTENGGGLTYALTGADAALFTLDPDTGVLTWNASPDFENPMDADTDNEYEVIVTVTDPDGGTDVQALTINVTDVGEGNIRISCVDPTTDKIVVKNFGIEAQDISAYRFCSMFSYTTDLANDMTVTTGSLILAGGQTVELTGFALTDAAADLSLYLPTGAFSDATAMVDFTQWGSAGNGRESVAVTKGIWMAGDFMTDLPEWCYTGDGTTENGVTFWDGNDLPVITSPSTATVPENTPITDIVIDVASTDDNDMETSGLTYSFTGVGANSPDEGDFNIDPTTGEITFVAVPDYENPTDDGTDNDYQVEVQVCDSGTPQGCTTQIINITVTDVDEDGDGFTGVDDPDDADPCVPSNAASPCCEAVAPTITKD